jgi:hypothetical protein
MTVERLPDSMGTGLLSEQPDDGYESLAAVRS